MNLDQAKDLIPGDRVYWDDPDSAEGLFFTIEYISVNGEVISITEQGGECTECYAHELFRVVRDRECMACSHEWTAPVFMSKNTTRLSGEQAVYCPKCDSNTVVSQPQRADRDAQQATLQLTLTVTYDLNGTPVESLRRLLCDVAQHAVDRGGLSGHYPAEVDNWEAEVNKL